MKRNGTPPEDTLTPDQRAWLAEFNRLRDCPFLGHRVRVVEGDRLAFVATNGEISA